MSNPVVPVPTEPPATPKKKKTGKVILIIVGVLVVVCGGLGVAGYLLVNKAVDSTYTVGTCLDSVSTSTTAQSAAVPNAVPCTDSKAVAKILKVADGKSTGDAETECSGIDGVTSYTVLLIKGGSTKLLCLGDK